MGIDIELRADGRRSLLQTAAFNRGPERQVKRGPKRARLFRKESRPILGGMKDTDNKEHGGEDCQFSPGIVGRKPEFQNYFSHWHKPSMYAADPSRNQPSSWA